jgi:NAD(P)-dependent dehydrogenase (short-subunit alcohol dehydrogenase family)
MPGRLEAKVVLVTGGSSGIGRAVAARSLTEGAAVVIAARRSDVGERTAAELRAAFDATGTGGGDVRFVVADVTSEEQVAALIDTTVRTFGRLDAAFNNAGDVVAPGPLPEIGADAWHAELAVNLTGVFHCLAHEIPALRASGGGAIVNNASLCGVRGIPGLSAYVAAKHGVVGLTRSAALECAADGVRVNALVTGNVDTPLYRRLLGAAYDVDRADLDAPNPAGRVASPVEIAALVVHLFSDEAAFVTGAALPIDGGATAG